MEIGLRIKQLRKEHNMTAKELAKLCNTSQPVISKLENGNRSVDVLTLQKICKVFNITLSDFFSYDNLSETINSNLKELLNNAKSLTPEQLQSLNNLIKTFTSKNKRK